jgi:hypothetical protein
MDWSLAPGEAGLSCGGTTHQHRSHVSEALRSLVSVAPRLALVEVETFVS